MADLFGTREVGIEIIDKTCWRCKRRLFSVSGVVTTDPDCAGWTKKEWTTDGWRLLDFYALYQFPDDVAVQLASHIDAMSKTAHEWLKKNNAGLARIDRRRIQAAGLTLWTSTCPKCKSTDGPAILIERERPQLVRDWRGSVHARKLIYRGATLKVASPCPTYEDIKAEHQIRHFLEGR